MQWVCDICGYIHEADEPPDFCPICGAPQAKFSELDPDEDPIEQEWGGDDLEEYLDDSAENY